MKRRLIDSYRRWQRLNHEGLSEGDFPGLRKFERAKAIGLLVAMLPTVPLMVSDEMGFERGWLWYGWAAMSISWFVGVLGLIAWNSGRSFAAYVRQWREKSK